VFKKHCYVHLTFQRCRRHREPLGPRVDEQEVVDVLISSTLFDTVVFLIADSNILQQLCHVYT